LTALRCQKTAGVGGRIGCIAYPLSIDDVFTVGVSLDLLGAYLLGRGLLASPAEIARRGRTLWGSNPADMIAQIRARADGRVGLTSLAWGFLLQAGGYVSLIGGTALKTGALRATASVAFAAAAGLVAWYVLRRLHRILVMAFVVDVARVDPVSGELRTRPDAGTLLALGQELGFLPTASEVPGPGKRMSGSSWNFDGDLQLTFTR
jgi:hypothetical protein